MSDPTGWSIRPHPVIGKTEVLSTDDVLIRRMKTAAQGIPASEVYPAFEAGYSHALFFFDVRPEFVNWLRETAAMMPGPAVQMPVARSTGRMAALWIVTSLMLLALLGGAWTFGGFGDGPPAEVPAAEGDASVAPSSDPANVVPTAITYSESVTIIDDPDPAVLPGAGMLEVWFVDVGQGDGIILRMPGGSFVLVDANAGAAGSITALLEKLGCTEIKAVVMSHPHNDHIGALPEILKRFKVGTFYDPGLQHTTKIYQKVLEAVEENGCVYVNPAPGDQITWDPRVRVTVLNSDFAATEVNNSSIVLRIEFGATSLILTGDAEKEGERAVVERFQGRLRSQLLKVGHHGSRSSTTDDFLREVAPQYAVISCGTGNSYKHPHDVTLAKLNASGVKIFRTDQQGTILARSNGREWRMEPEKGKEQ